MPDVEEDWLPCLPWDGREKSLPRGGQMAGGLVPEYLIYRVEIIDPESDSGFKEIRLSELLPDMKDKIVGIKFNEGSYKKLQATYGDAFLQIEQADGPNLTREAWREKYQTDGMGLWAIRRIRYPIDPVTVGYGGIHVPSQMTGQGRRGNIK